MYNIYKLPIIQIYYTGFVLKVTLSMLCVKLLHYLTVIFDIIISGSKFFVIQVVFIILKC